MEALEGIPAWARILSLVIFMAIEPIVIQYLSEDETPGSEFYAVGIRCAPEGGCVYRDMEGNTHKAWRDPYLGEWVFSRGGRRWFASDNSECTECL